MPPPNRVGITEDKVMMNIERYGNTNGWHHPAVAVGLKEAQKGDNLIWLLCRRFTRARGLRQMGLRDSK